MKYPEIQTHYPEIWIYRRLPTNLISYFVFLHYLRYIPYYMVLGISLAFSLYGTVYMNKFWSVRSVSIFPRNKRYLIRPIYLLRIKSLSVVPTTVTGIALSNLNFWIILKSHLKKPSQSILLLMTNWFAFREIVLVWLSIRKSSRDVVVCKIPTPGTEIDQIMTLDDKLTVKNFSDVHDTI